MKNSFEEIRNNGSSYFLELVQRIQDMEEFSQLNTSIFSLIPEDVLEEYNEQIKLAQQIFEYLDYVKESGLEYKDILEALLERNENDLFGFFKKAIDMYFENQTSTIAPVLASVNIAHQYSVQQMQALGMKTWSGIKESVNSRAQSYLNRMKDDSLRNQINNYYLGNYYERMKTISIYAQWASGDA